MRVVFSICSELIFSRSSWNANFLKHLLFTIFILLFSVSSNAGQGQYIDKQPSFENPEWSINVYNQLVGAEIIPEVQDVISEKSDDDEEKRLGNVLGSLNASCPKGPLFLNHTAYAFTKQKVKLYVLFHSWRSFID